MLALIVAVEAVQDVPLCAHAVPDLGALTGRYGAALCGVPADLLTLAPDMAWLEVALLLRCRHCQAEWSRTEA